MLAIVLGLVAGGCGGDGPTESGGLSGTFDLVTIDGVPPPKLELINMALDTLFFTGAEMRVLSRGRLSMVRRHRWHSAVNGPLPESPDTAIVTFRLSGTELLLEYPVSVPFGPYTDTAEVLDDDAIVVRTKIYGLALGTVYVRNYRYHKR